MNQTQRLAYVALMIIVLVGLAQTISISSGTLATELPLLLQWPDYDAQTRVVLGAELYDMLAAADAALPPRAALLLVTAGADPRHREYVAFHRALYHLAPRPIWWANPAAPDGTWESRWWIPLPLSADALEALARSKNISFLLFFDAPIPAELAAPLTLTPHAQLVSLRADTLGNQHSTSAAPPNLVMLAVGLLVIVALGHALVAVAMRLGFTAGRVERMSLTWPLGAGAVSILMLWLNALGLARDMQLAVITAIALAALLVLEWPKLRSRHRPLGGSAKYAARRRPAMDNLDNALSDARHQELPPTAARSRIVALMLTLLIVVVMVFVALLAIGRPLTIWDAWVNWAIKARIIFLEHGITADLFADPSRTVTQLDYPLLLPLVEAWTFAWAGSADDWTTGIASLFFYVSLLGICYGACRTRMNVTASLFVALAVALLTPLSGLAIAVMTDLPLAALAAIAALWVVRWLETRERGALFIAALATGLLPWTKREGVLLLAALCLALLIVNRRARAAWLAAGAMALAALLLSGPWWLFMLFNGVRNVAFAPFTLANLQLNLWRLPHIAWLELLRLISADWNWLWPVAALMALAASVTRHQRADIWPLVALVYLGAMSFAYVFSDFVPFQQHVVSSVDRLLAHVAPLLVLWIAYRCPVAHRLNDHSK